MAGGQNMVESLRSMDISRDSEHPSSLHRSTLFSVCHVIVVSTVSQQSLLSLCHAGVCSSSTDAL